MQQQYYNHLLHLLTKLKDGHGHFIIQTGSFMIDHGSAGRFCQFSKRTQGETVCFEVLSHYFEPTLPTFLSTYFFDQGFRLEKGENYRKEITLYSEESIRDTLEEVVHIFENIFRVPQEGVYDFDDQISSASSTKHHVREAEIVQVRSAKWNFPPVGYAIIGVLIILYVIARFRSSKSEEPHVKKLENTSTAAPFVNEQFATSSDVNKPAAPHKSNLTLAVSIIKVIKDNHSLFGMEVRIPRKLYDPELIEVAKRVKNEIKPRSDKGTIFFLLPGKQPGTGAWSAVDFEPRPVVRRIGQSIEDEVLLRRKAVTITGYMGLWMSLYQDGLILYGIRKTSGQYYWEIVDPQDPKPSWLASLLEQQVLQGKIVYFDTESTAGEYYVVEKNGDLSVYDEHGHIETYIKVK